jgi:hypothetical protein
MGNIKLIIVPKIVLITAITLKLINNISMANIDLQVVIIDQL